jgi:hypothetical protein
VESATLHHTRELVESPACCCSCWLLCHHLRSVPSAWFVLR